MDWSVFLYYAHCVAVYMAAYVDGYRQSGDVCRIGVDVDGKRGCRAAEAAGTYAGAVDFV